MTLLDLMDAPLPHQGRTPHARHASYQGARAASRSIGRKSRVMLDVLLDGPLTDAQIYDAMVRHLPMRPSSVQSIRSILIGLGLVEDSGLTEASPYGRAVRVVRWQVTTQGREMAR